MTSVFSPNSAARDPTRITRIQLQRLLDVEPDLAKQLRDAEFKEKLGAKVYPAKIRALDVIRKYLSQEALNRKLIFENLLGAASVTNAVAVKRGITEVLADIETSWKDQLEDLSQICQELSTQLETLKDGVTSFESTRRFN